MELSDGTVHIYPSAAPHLPPNLNRGNYTVEYQVLEGRKPVSKAFACQCWKQAAAALVESLHLPGSKSTLTSQSNIVGFISAKTCTGGLTKQSQLELASQAASGIGSTDCPMTGL